MSDDEWKKMSTRKTLHERIKKTVMKRNSLKNVSSLGINNFFCWNIKLMSEEYHYTHLNSKIDFYSSFSPLFKIILLAMEYYDYYPFNFFIGLWCCCVILNSVSWTVLIHSNGDSITDNVKSNVLTNESPHNPNEN